ncbi:MAG: hypothetical protein F6J86_40740 [Symploca sp. SIO1B1]|nr:hypothetical protein [Symploca sp. SIO1B1]
MFNLTRHGLLKMATSLLLAITFLLVSTVPPAFSLVADDAQATDIETIIVDIPTGDRWLEHLKNDLLPFWDMEVTTRLMAAMTVSYLGGPRFL